jgi:hypothetical protein
MPGDWDLIQSAHNLCYQYAASTLDDSQPTGYQAYGKWRGALVEEWAAKSLFIFKNGVPPSVSLVISDSERVLVRGNPNGVTS